MVLDIDGFAVFRSIGAHPRAFASIATEVAKVARGLVVKQINAKTSDLKSVRNICAAIGRDSFDLILDGLTDGQVKSLVAKVDKHHPETKGEVRNGVCNESERSRMGSPSPLQSPPPQ
jgi:hypothetical protein